MIAGFRAGWRAIRQMNHQSHLYVWGNLLWVVLSLPVVTAPAAWMALVRLSYMQHRHPGVTMDEFWDAFKQNWRRSIVLALVNAAIIGVNAGNLIAYWDAPGVFAAVLRSVWLLLLLGWFALQLFAYPLFFAMEKPTLVGAFRNAAVMIVSNPLYTVAVTLVGVVMIAFGVLLPPAMLLLVGGAVAALSNSAVQDRLWAAGLQQRPRQPDASTEESFYADF